MQGKKAHSVIVLPDPESLALAVATAVVIEARRAVKRSGRFTIALSGGSTPKRAYELLAGRPFADEIPWASTHVFWGDERCVGPHDARSNERMAREALLDHVPVPSSQVQPMRCPGRTGSETSGGAPDSRLAHEAADEYERLLRAHGSAMDLVLLGLGEDGHTASLFPGSRTLDEKGRWAAPVFREANGSAGGAGTEPFWRVTLTPSFINQAKAVFFLASGTAKAAISRRVIDGGTGTERLPTHRLPAQLIRPADGVLCWFLDEDAASQLSEHGGA